MSAVLTIDDLERLGRTTGERSLREELSAAGIDPEGALTLFRELAEITSRKMQDGEPLSASEALTVGVGSGFLLGVLAGREAERKARTRPGRGRRA